MLATQKKIQRDNTVKLCLLLCLITEKEYSNTMSVNNIKFDIF